MKIINAPVTVPELSSTRSNAELPTAGKHHLTSKIYLPIEDRFIGKIIIRNGKKLREKFNINILFNDDAAPKSQEVPRVV